MNKRILTIQDISCVGQCSITVALPVISACGVETSILPSSVLSTHTGGFSGYTFRDLTEDMPAIESHWMKEGIRFDAVYTGYVTAGQIDHIKSISENCTNPGAIRIVDPAMADNGTLYAGFGKDFPDRMAELCEGADYILPNLTEANLLLRREMKLSGYDKTWVLHTAEALMEKLHVKNVVLTGISLEEGKTGAAIYDGSCLTVVSGDKIGGSFHGTGDVFSSAFTGCLMRGLPAADACRIAADFVCESIRNTPADHVYGVCFEQAIPKLVTDVANALAEK